MTSHFGSEDDRFMFTPKPPHFFKIILDHILRDGKLGIPRKFVKKYGNDLSNLAVLKVPSGEVWPVELSKCAGEIWFQKGWREFAEFYSLCKGHFLVFRYQGNCNFHVLIFDMSASEIDYPYTQADDKQSESSFDSDVRFQDLNVEEAEDDVSIEILDTAPSKKRREKSPIRCLRSQKIMKTNMTNKTDKILKPDKARPIKLDRLRGSTSSSCSKQDDHGGLKPSTRRGTRMENGLESPEADILSFKYLTAKEKAKTLGIANAFNSKNPFFLVVIYPSHISHCHRMCMPNNFAGKYLPKRHGGGEAILCLSDRKFWCVKYFRSVCNENPRAIFKTGWKKFALDNDLVVGDICLFELLKGSEISFKVVIHRVVADADCDPFHVPAAPDPEVTSRFASNVPFFEKIVNSSHLYHGRVYIPVGFVEKHFKPGTSNVTLQVGERLWSVRMTIFPYCHIGKLADGWIKFAEENSLRVGDVCVFKLISSSDALLNVSIFRKDK
ncbi:hypothetical protein REPUB_Repub10bG0152000 [Reevesia pubescens]